MQKLIFPILLLIFTVGCKQPQGDSEIPKEPQSDAIKYATGFSVETYDQYKIVSIQNPWPGSDKTFRYALVEKNAKIPESESFDAIVQVPVNHLVVTSTTHIPSLEMLKEENSLIGFPNLNYISSETTRALIEAGKIKELGKNEALNTEIVIESAPDVVVTFAVEGQNSTVNTLINAGIPVLYNGDWTESHPLGKAEWLKFFGLLFKKEKLADSIFSGIEENYLKAKELATKSKIRPTVLSGAMYRDVWYLPQGDSWAAAFIADGNGEYLWADRKGTGSISLNLESVLQQGQNADFWIGPSQFTSYQEMLDAHQVYGQFEAFKNRQVYSFTNKKGATGGVLYYELAPNRPDLVLNDIIKILHPELLPDYELFFFAPLN